MSVSVTTSTLSSKVARAATLLKTKGVTETAKAIFYRLSLQLRISMLGRSRTISMDGCEFPLRDVPDTSMKLELLLGNYEQPERSAARRYVKPEWPVVELGGCIGVVACITNKLLSTPGRHVVVEANPCVVPQLEANRAANQCSFSVLNKAIAYDVTSIRLTPSPDFWGTSLYARGDSQQDYDVPATQLSRIVEDARFENFALICDIEGQEYELVRNELETLRRAEVIIMEVHPHLLGEAKVSETLSELGKIGFSVTERTASVVVLCRT
jgi:FkbM family methyltransferase